MYLLFIIYISMPTNSKTRKTKTQKKNTTRKTLVVEKLHKCSRSRITGMESYKINCGKNLLRGYHTIKAAEETSTHKDDFVHVVLSELKDYDKPVVVKVYDEDNIHLHIELNILKKVNGFRNTPRLICGGFAPQRRLGLKGLCSLDFDPQQQTWLGTGLKGQSPYFFVYEYISQGDISDFLNKNQEIDVIKSLILQITCVIIQLAEIYKVYHGDINSGNILVDATHENTVEYCIDDETFTIESQGIIPKIIDYGRSNFYKGTIPNDHIWFDVIMTLSVIYPYIKNDELKHKVFDISTKTDMYLPSLKDYYIYIRDAL